MPRQRSAPELYDADPFEGGGVLGSLGRMISAHPSLAGGTVAFTVIFGFIASNALWSQPGRHPAPILKTRDVAGPVARALTEAPVTPSFTTTAPAFNDVPARTVTTFRIERNDQTPTASIPVPNPTPVALSAPNRAETPATAAASQSQPRAAVTADPVLVRMQEILAARGLYSGEIDGLMGPKSAAAIRNWEKANGYVETGQPSAGLLAVMDVPSTSVAPQAAVPVAPVETVSLDAAPTPQPRPERQSESGARTNDRASGPAVTEPAVTVPVAADPAVNELVRRIQSGLSNIAYADIAVDGVAGAQTRSAIRAFEKHYRLPVTGEPNETVLDKLIEIGAL